MTERKYSAGFGNEHMSEAIAGALPIGQFSPQNVPLGLYTEKFSATAFTAPRAENRRTWFYRIRPSVLHGEFNLVRQTHLLTAPLKDVITPPNQLRWDPIDIPDQPADFIDGLVTVVANGDSALQVGMAAHLYLANKSMGKRYFYCADGELLIVPQTGALTIRTECGVLDVVPGEIALIPRGMKFAVDLVDGAARGYVCENYGHQFRLPERGPVGSDGYANDRDFLAPVAAFEDLDGDYELLCKFQGHLYQADIDHSPLDVVAWVGTSVPYKYDLALFNAMNSVTFDHPDPSIFTVLTSPSDTEGVANSDFVIFPPRWAVSENTFRPPWYHRNTMSEFMGNVRGVYEGKKKGFRPGGMSLHNQMMPHGPDVGTYQAGSVSAPEEPARIKETLSFMFESRFAFQVSDWAMTHSARQEEYRHCWDALPRTFVRSTGS
jgi:homogentisate 1,2-dioxygenase